MSKVTRSALDSLGYYGLCVHKSRLKSWRRKKNSRDYLVVCPRLLRTPSPKPFSLLVVAQPETSSDPPHSVVAQILSLIVTSDRRPTSHQPPFKNFQWFFFVKRQLKKLQNGTWRAKPDLLALLRRDGSSIGYHFQRWVISERKKRKWKNFADFFETFEKSARDVRAAIGA